MSAEAIAGLPAVFTLTDVAHMGETDEHHRFELSTEGVLHVMTPADTEHYQIVMRLIVWLVQHGWTADELLAEAGVQITGGTRLGGREPDLSVWRPGSVQPGITRSFAASDGAVLFVEVESVSTRHIDRTEKFEEYAKAGVPRYWRVDRDGPAPVVCRYVLDGDAYIPEGEPVALTWLLNQTPPRLA